MTPPIDPVEETSIENDVEALRATLNSPALDRFLAEVKRLREANDQLAKLGRESWAEVKRLRLDREEYMEALTERMLEAERELTLEKQRGEALRAALERAIELVADWNHPNADELDDIAREALRISQEEGEAE